MDMTFIINKRQNMNSPNKLPQCMDHAKTPSVTRIPKPLNPITKTEIRLRLKHQYEMHQFRLEPWSILRLRLCN